MGVTRNVTRCFPVPIVNHRYVIIQFFTPLSEVRILKILLMGKQSCKLLGAPFSHVPGNCCVQLCGNHLSLRYTRVTDEVLLKLYQDGFVMVDQALSPAVCETLRHEMDVLLENGQMWDSQSYSHEEGALHHDICVAWLRLIFLSQGPRIFAIVPCFFLSHIVKCSINKPLVSQHKVQVFRNPGLTVHMIKRVASQVLRSLMQVLPLPSYLPTCLEVWGTQTHTHTYP